MKEEQTGWKVFVECSHEACSLERTVGRVSAAAVDGMDAVHERASAKVAGR